MAKNKTGALIVIERNIPMGDVVSGGIELHAAFSKDLLLTIFHPDTPLHDGGGHHSRQSDRGGGVHFAFGRRSQA